MFHLKGLLLFFFTFLIITTAKNVKKSTAKGLRLPVCGENEVARTCKYACPPDDCASLYVQYLCIANQTCAPGCVCEPGYLRTNSSGICIPQEQCLPLECANDPNAVRGCGDRCKKTCKDYYDINKKCSSSAGKACKLFGCDCRDGYVYDENVDKCVKPEDCTPQCYGQNERYDSCANANCSPLTCDDLGYPIACPSVTRCDGACLCQEGFVRNECGICISSRECPSCGGDNNAVTGCGVNCSKRCGEQNGTIIAPCPRICKFNSCDCKSGFYFDSTVNRCVEPQSCTSELEPEQTCPDPNASWVPCGVNCPNDICPENDQPQPVCDPPNPCPGGCKCNLNYKLLNGKCVLAATCPAQECTGQNQVWATCPECLAEDCANKDDPPAACNTFIENCQPKCICKEDTFRNGSNICVSRSQCPN